MPKNAQHDQESEQAILAALMSERNIYKQIDLSIDDFYEKINQQIYKIIIELAEEGLEPEYVAVSAKIKSLGLSGEIPKTYIYDLCEKIPGAITKQWKNYVAIIKKKSAARKLRDLALNLQKVSQNGLNDLSGKIDVALRQLVEIRDKAAGKNRSISEQVREWILTTANHADSSVNHVNSFLTTDCHVELGLTTPDHKKAANMALLRLADDGVITPCGPKRGCYRIVRDSEEIDWMSADTENIYRLKWPFQLENLVTIYPGNICVVAGEKNAGKSAFLYNLIKLNQKTHKINYYNSESGKEELKLRLSKFDDLRVTDWNFKAYARSSNFPEAIHPDKLNIIDYYEVTDDFYKIGGEIRQIHERLRKGVCVIALQKKAGSEYGRGGDFSREKSRLYLTMGNGILTIKDGKIWASDVNPNGVTIKYKLVSGCKFIEMGGSKYDL